MPLRVEIFISLAARPNPFSFWTMHFDLFNTDNLPLKNQISGEELSKKNPYHYGKLVN